MDHDKAGKKVAELATKLAGQKGCQTEPLPGMLEGAAKMAGRGQVAAALNMLYAAAHHGLDKPVMPAKARAQCQELRHEILGAPAEPAAETEEPADDPADETEEPADDPDA